MKRTRSILLVILSLAVIGSLAACGASPRERAKTFTRYLPEEVGQWERDDKSTVELLASTVTNKGHVTLLYEGTDDAIAYIVVEAHPSEDAAEVAITSRERELLLLGLAPEKDRAPKLATALVAQDERSRYALFQEEQIVVEINALAAEDGASVSDEAFAELLTIVRNAYSKVEGD